MRLRLPQWVRAHALASAGVLAAACLSLAVATFYSLPPGDFPVRDIAIIKDGTGLSQTADLLVAQHVIKSAFFYKVFVVLLGGQKKIIAGDYLFDAPQSALRVAYRTVYGVQGLAKFKVTIPEGTSVAGIAATIEKVIPAFDEKGFLRIATPYEGYLFPDTYYLYENASPEDALSLMRGTFNDRIHGTLPAITSFGRPLAKVIIMASIVEREATSTMDKRIIAGILWKRLDAGTPLQVDAPLYYILKKDSSQLTLTDLATSSPYNLYRHTGLTPAPIDNPGLDAIQDTVTPIQTQYWYFLSGSDGATHYAETFDQHEKNIVKYIK